MNKHIVFMKFKRSSFIKKVGVLLCFVAFALSANAQTRKVTGQIVDESGQPIIGATIRLQDATTGTITDIDGHFSLNVPDGKKVVISYIGYLKQVILPKGDTLKVILQEDNQKLDEVVVVGYGSMKQKNITGSVSTISAEELEDLPVSNLSEALQGMVNGLNVQLGSSRQDPERRAGKGLLILINLREMSKKSATLLDISTKQ